MKPMSYRVRPLTSNDWPAIETLFGRNGACGGCWCMWWRVPRGGKLWEAHKGAPNKEAFRRLVESGEASGCLAFYQGEPVGWCAAGPRAAFPRLERVKALATAWTPGTWCVNCFFIPARWRGKGVATALLPEAVALASRAGASVLEAYPVVPRQTNQPVPAAFAWTGVPKLFERTGFRNVTPPGNPRPIYLLELSRTGDHDERTRLPTPDGPAHVG